MPFKSQAQRAKFAEMVKAGKISQSTFDEWNQATGDTPLPVRVEKKVSSQIKTGTPLHQVLSKSRKKRKR